jgi:hypothetical protein
MKVAHLMKQYMIDAGFVDVEEKVYMVSFSWCHRLSRGLMFYSCLMVRGLGTRNSKSSGECSWCNIWMQLSRMFLFLSPTRPHIQKNTSRLGFLQMFILALKAYH